MEASFVDNLNKRISTRLSRPPMSLGFLNEPVTQQPYPSALSLMPMMVAPKKSYTGVYIAIGVVGLVALVLMLLMILRNRDDSV